MEDALELMAGNQDSGDLGGNKSNNEGDEASNPRPLRRCGNCGEIGYNSRTCQVARGMSKEDNSD